MNFKSKIKEIKKESQSKVLDLPGENWYGKIFSRKISVYFTYLFLKFKIKPNSITIFSIFSGILGCVFLSFHNIYLIIFGISLLQLWLVLDCSDGEVARYTKNFSIRGVYIDIFGHYLINVFLFVCFIKIIKFNFNIFYLILFFVLIASMSFKRLPPDLLNSIFYKKEVGYKRYKNPKSSNSKLIKKQKSKILNLIYFLYNTVTIMLVLSFANLFNYLNISFFGVKILEICFLFYSLTLPIVIFGNLLLIANKLS